MSLKLFSSYNYSTPHSNISFTNSIIFDNVICLFYKPSSIIFITFCIVNIFLLLPLCIFILRHGFQQCLQKSSFSSAAAVRHSDCFTHHVAILELIAVFGCFLCISGVFCNCPNITFIGYIAYSFTCCGETFFHLQMCLEHYLAVVYPITYMSLRKERGIKIRNICIFWTWLLCFAGWVLMLTPAIAIVTSFFLTVIAITINGFCCLSVLCVLIHPGPERQSGGTDRREKIKYRAFYTILAILGVLVVRFLCGLLWVLVTLTKCGDHCLVVTCNAWFNLPSSLVLPLLFLQRAGRCLCLKINK